MRRVGAAHRYVFDDAYYHGLMDALDDGLLVVEVREDAAVVASALLMRHGDRAHYHLSGSDPAASRRGANAMLVWTMMEWCAESGAAVCHLGGGVSEGDGLAVFKRSFGGQAEAFHVGQAVVEPVSYARLTRARAIQLATTVDDLEQTDYFPAFRASPG
jgi:lipid II:glycine glycyltransferase (peptidoglycan interpeptide bridge formation enzyme)